MQTRSKIFAGKVQSDIEMAVISLVNSEKDLMSARTLNSPRAVGDAIQEVLESKFDSLLPKAILKEYNSSFARRSMADFAFTDNDGFYYVVDNKTHNLDMQNMVVNTEWNWLEFFDYPVNATSSRLPRCSSGRSRPGNQDIDWREFLLSGWKIGSGHGRWDMEIRGGHGRLRVRVKTRTLGYEDSRSPRTFESANQDTDARVWRFAQPTDV